MPDEMDRAQAASEVYENAAMRSHFSCKPKIASIVTARDCEDCGNPIPAARLKANPAALRCVPCQTKFERGGYA